MYWIVLPVSWRVVNSQTVLITFTAEALVQQDAEAKKDFKKLLEYTTRYVVKN